MCKTILGLLDLMGLNLVNFNCRVSDSLDDYHTSLAFDSCEEKLVPSSTKNPLFMDPGLNQSFQVLADYL